jgi:hypothetical protein
VNVVRATVEGLRSMHSAEELGQRRGKNLHSVISGQPMPGRDNVSNGSNGNGNGAAAKSETPAKEASGRGR